MTFHVHEREDERFPVAICGTRSDMNKLGIVLEALEGQGRLHPDLRGLKVQLTAKLTHHPTAIGQLAGIGDDSKEHDL
jgi:hypothetical protein